MKLKSKYFLDTKKSFPVVMEKDGMLFFILDLFVFFFPKTLPHVLVKTCVQVR